MGKPGMWQRCGSPTAIIVAMPQPDRPVQLPPADAAQPSDTGVAATTGFNAGETVRFQAKMPKAPVWFCSFLASNQRETRRFRDAHGLMNQAVAATADQVWMSVSGLPLRLKPERGTP